MRRSGQKLIQAAREAAAMARGEAVPGAVIHRAPAEVAAAEPYRDPGDASACAATVQDTSGEPS